MESGQNQNRLKRLELLGGIGAGVLGAGLALLFAKWLYPFAIPALLAGIACHGWAMFQKSRLEQQLGVVQPAWVDWAERACWIMLSSVVLYIAYRILL